ncbi:MAG TPA: protocatechuate 3,4-dioxygenase subunit alpha [Vicinamibacteria bacterium]
MRLPRTPSQTVGPFFSLGLSWLTRAEVAPRGVAGQAVRIEGRVLDGDGLPVPDALLEVWQADAGGKYAHPEDTQDKTVDLRFLGFGRVPTDAEGRFAFTTVKPGPVPGPGDDKQAPHLVVSVFARGLLRRLVTRLYFPDEPANARDFVLGLVEPGRRGTLIATSKGPGVLEWNVVLQGQDETAFFEA